MASTKKTSGSGGAKRTAGTSKRAAPKSTAKRKSTAARPQAARKSASGARKPSARAKSRPTKAGSRLKLKIGLTLLVCFVVVVLAVLGTVYYDRLVPAKSPAVAKNKTSVTVHVPMETRGEKAKPAPAQQPAAKAPVTQTKPAETKTVTPETAKPKDTAVTQAKPVTAEKPAVTPPAAKKPKLALIFDDMGNDIQAAQKLQNLKIPLTFSILPYSAKGKELAKNAPGHIEIMVHVPMQAQNGSSDSEQGLLRSDMTEAELAQVLRADLDRVPNVRGVNNHTGSKLTQQLVPMQVVMLVLKERNLFFIDSKTSEKSVAKDAAQMLLVPTASRDYFLDHVADKGTIKEQLYQAVATAKRRGWAIAIGHPRPLTLEVVLKELPELAKEIEFVPASALVK